MLTWDYSTSIMKNMVSLNFNQHMLVKFFFCKRKTLVKVIRFVFGAFFIPFLLIAFLQNNHFDWIQYSVKVILCPFVQVFCV